MAKYYVESGSVREIVDAATPIDGAVKAVQRNWERDEGEEMALGLAVFVSEKGFEPIHDDDTFILAEEVLKRAGLFTHFRKDKRAE